MPIAARRVNGCGALRRNSTARNPPVAVTGPTVSTTGTSLGCLLVRDVRLQPGAATHVLAQYVFGLGAVLYGGNFAVRRDALEAIGGFDTSIEFHGEDTNLARRVSKAGRVRSAGSRAGSSLPRAATKPWAAAKVFGLYVRNFCAEIFFHRPSDTTHEDVRA